MKRLTAILLAMILALGLALPAQAKTAPAQGPLGTPWEVDTEHPVIIVHGIGQSEVFLCEDDNITKVLGSDGKPVQGWPPKIDINGILPKLILPLLASLLLQHDIFLTSTLRGLAGDILSVFKMDETGHPTQNMQVERWHRYGGGVPTSLKDLATLAPAQRSTAYGHIPLEGMADLVGEENMYYFAYDSFGNLGDIVEELYQLIQDILAKHGTDKINVIPISLGGTVMNGLVEYYKDRNIYKQLNNVVYVIAALDGSNIVGDLFTRQFATDNESLYRTMLPGLVEGYLGYLLNIAIRLLPKRLVMKVLDAVIDGAVGDVVGRSTMIWALLPQKYYAQASAEWLSDPSMANIKAQVAKYHDAQVNARDNIVELRSKGVNCYAISEYNYPMYNFVASAKSVSSDGVIHTDSTSMGATSVGVNKPLPADYVPKTPGYMDESRLIDASTGALPDYTWYFKNQDHERTGRCDVVMNLTLRLACGEADPTVHDMPEWPQFNHGREGRWLTSNVDRYKGYDTTKIADDADRAEFIAAYAELKRQSELTIVVPGEREAIEARFTNIMVKIGEWTAPKQPTFWEKAGDKVAWFFSEAFYFGYGPRGFIDPFWRIWCD